MKISSIPRFTLQVIGDFGPEFRGRLCSLKSFVHTPVPIRFLISTFKVQQYTYSNDSLVDQDIYIYICIFVVNIYKTVRVPHSILEYLHACTVHIVSKRKAYNYSYILCKRNSTMDIPHKNHICQSLRGHFLRQDPSTASLGIWRSWQGVWGLNGEPLGKYICPSFFGLFRTDPVMTNFSWFLFFVWQNVGKGEGLDSPVWLRDYYLYYMFCYILRKKHYSY